MLFRASIFLASLSLAAAGGQGNGNGNANGNANGANNGFANQNPTTNNGATIPLTESFIRSVNGAEDARSAPDAELIRLSGTNYPDGVGLGLSGVEGSVPNARMISNTVADPETLPPNAQPGKSRASDMLWQWGQFMDHDIGLTEEMPNNNDFTITSPDCANDVICTINMRRAFFHWSDATPQVREQLNEITGFLDANTVYGSTIERNAALRDNGNGGRMLMTADGLLPGILSGVNNAFPDFLSANAPDQFSGGDIRVNEQLGLLAIHTLWVREHNRRAGQLQQAFPTATDEQLYQMARKIVIAEIQAITYKEFLPILIGTAAPDLAAYTGFDPNVNPGTSQEFSACAFRVGHTFLSERLLFHDGNGVVGSESLVNLFFTPGSVRQNPLLIDLILIGQTINPANEADTKVIPAVRDNLFGLPDAGVGRDLVVFNIMRGRDHGLPRYNDMRAGLGLTRKFNFNEVTRNPLIAAELSTAYGGDVNLCDPWICGLAEDAVGGGELGELFSFIIADQFQRYMDGDRFFYLNDPDVRAQSLLNIGIDVDTITLADVINANTIGGVGPDAMLA